MSDLTYMDTGDHDSANWPDPEPETLGEALAEIARLRAENFALAAGACHFRSGDEHGNPICLRTNSPLGI